MKGLNRQTVSRDLFAPANKAPTRLLDGRLPKNAAQKKGVSRLAMDWLQTRAISNPAE
jgi:hypothetical protein